MGIEASAIDAFIVGFFGLLGTLATLYWGKIQRRRALKSENLAIDTRERENFNRLVANPMVGLPKWGDFMRRMTEFQVRESISRVIIFVCVNGKNDPKEMNAIYQFRIDPIANQQAYIGVDIARQSDNGDYISRLMQTRSNGKLIFSTKDLRDCLIKDIYIDEKIEQAIWLWLGSISSKKTGQVAGIYLSASSEKDDVITEPVAADLQRLSWELSKVMQEAYAKTGHEMMRALP